MKSNMSEADRRLNVESRILDVISKYGGEVLVADNPAMPRMIAELRVMCDELAIEGWLPTIAEARS